MGWRRLGATCALWLVVPGAAACGSASHAASSSTVPSNLSNFEAVLKGSGGESVVSQLPPGLAESIGNGICQQLGQGETPAQISKAALASSESGFPPQAFAEVMVAASQWLCPKYASEVQQFAQG